MRSFSFFALALLACASCSSTPANDAAPAPMDTGGNVPADKVCDAGFAPLDGGAGCAPILVTETCKPGTRARIGSATCVPVGVTACAAGFARDATGWGCDAILPAAACAIGSGTRERLGSATCMPVSDCNAAFPPAGATMFVDAAFADGALDATHFRTINEAVTAAAAGAVIAVASGTYSEKVTLAHRKVSIIGRCAEQVIMQQVAGVLGSGIEVNRGDDALLKNITLRGYNAAVAALGGNAILDSLIIEDGLLAGVIAGNVGTDLSLTNVVVRGMTVRKNNDQGFGVFASDGANMTVTDSVLSENEFVNAGATAEGTTMTISRSILRAGKPYGVQGLYGMGAYIAQGASADIVESAIIDNSSAGLDVFSDTTGKSSATLKRSVIRRTKRDPGKQYARGITLIGADLVVEQSTIGGSAELELTATSGSTVQISDATFLGVAPTVATERGGLGFVIDSSSTKAHSVAIVSSRAGIELEGTAKLTMDASLVGSTLTAPVEFENGHWIGVGIAAEEKSSLVLSSSTVDGAHTIGILVTSTAKLSETLVRGTRPGGDNQYGRAFCVQEGGSATIDRSGFVNNSEAGVVAQIGGTMLTMTSSVIEDTILDHDGHFGIGLLLDDDTIGSIDTSTITKSAGIGLAAAAAGGFVHHTTISRNTVGVHTQDGTALTSGNASGDKLSLVVSDDTRFVDNQTRVGSGVVPLPAVLDPRKK